MMTVVVVALLGTVLTFGSAVAGGTPVQKCSASKRKASGKKAKGKFGCLSKAAKKSIPIDPACISKAETSFMNAFAKADAKISPSCEGTEGSVETAIDNCIDQVSQQITGNGKCQGSKLKAAGKKAVGMLACYAKAATTGTVDPTCTGNAMSKFGAAFDKADGTAPCPGAKDVVEQQIDDACVTAVVQQLPPVAVGCGNGIVDPGETCDDGNTVDGDDCPSNCVIQGCLPVQGSSFSVSVKLTPPPGTPVGGAGLFIDYPEGAVRLPATSFASGVSGSSHDRDYGITEELIDANGTGLPASPNAALTLTFKTCQGAAVPTAADFTCTVTDASDENANTIDPGTMSCAVTIP